PAGARQAARQCQPSLQDDGLQPRQLLPVQGALRARRRTGPAGNQSQEAGVEEPRAAGDRGCYRNAGDRAAGFRPGPRCQRAQAARAHGLPRRRALCVATPRPGDHEQAAQGAGSQERLVLTEAQVVALEKAKTEKEAHGEFESEHPGYCGAQDTFYVGNLKGVGRIYQQTFIDTYTKVSFAKLYDRKTPITAADLLN